jgi:hypothetical protein
LYQNFAKTRPKRAAFFHFGFAKKPGGPALPQSRPHVDPGTIEKWSRLLTSAAA